MLLTIKINTKPLNILILSFLLLFLPYSFASSLKINIPNEYESNLSFIIKDNNSDRIIFSHNALTPRLIASNMKLFTAAIALDVLKSNFKWYTKLFYSGSIENEELNGNLYILGGGDPTFKEKDLYNLFKYLKKMHINTINGDIFIDNSIFNSLTKYSMLENDLYDSDTAQPSGLIIDENLTRFELMVNNKSTCIKNNLYGYKVINELQVVKGDASCRRPYEMINVVLDDNKVTLRGEIPKSCNKKVLYYNLLSNLNYNTMRIKEVLNNLGIGLNGEVKEGKLPQDNINLITDYSSNSLEHALITMNHFSDNLIAQTVLLSIGAYTTDNLDTYLNSSQIFYNYLQNHNLDNPNFKLENGAGLSRTEKLSVKNIMDLLSEINKSPLQAEFEATLPVPGQEGTLKTSFLTLKGELHAKTGTLNDVKAYSGYYYSPKGHKYTISFVINNIDTKDEFKVTQLNKWIAKVLNMLR